MQKHHIAHSNHFGTRLLWYSGCFLDHKSIWWVKLSSLFNCNMHRSLLHPQIFTNCDIIHHDICLPLLSHWESISAAYLLHQAAGWQDKPFWMCKGGHRTLVCSQFYESVCCYRLYCLISAVVSQSSRQRMPNQLLEQHSFATLRVVSRRPHIKHR